MLPRFTTRSAGSDELSDYFPILVHGQLEGGWDEVRWKTMSIADSLFLYKGRYLMFIEDENRIYMIDRNNYIFQVDSLRFPRDRTCSTHLTNTLVDGVIKTSTIVHFWLCSLLRNSWSIMIKVWNDLGISSMTLSVTMLVDTDERILSHRIWCA